MKTTGFKFIVVVLALCGLWGGVFAGEDIGEKRTFSAMHAVVEIIIPEKSGSEIAPARLADSAEEIIRKLDGLLSPKGELSDVRRLNASAPGEWIDVDSMTLAVVLHALRWHRLSDGLFEPTVAPLKRLFRFSGKTLERWPSEEELEEAKRAIGADKLLVDETTCRLSWAQPGMSLDLGAIAKGFAADMAAEHLQAVGVVNALVNVGGEMRVLGSKPGEPPSPWQISIKSPRKNAEPLLAEAHDRALATSGDYESYFEYEGKRYSHIINPVTGAPLQELVAGVTVIHPDSATHADALATLLSILGHAKAVEFFKRNADAPELRGVEAIFFEVDAAGAVDVKRAAVPAE